MSYEFTHFEIYVNYWHKSFRKNSDPLVLFYHWCLIQNRFKCLNKNKVTELLPDNWNEKECYDLNYTKHGVNFRLEIFIVQDMLYIQMRRLTDMMDTLQKIKIDEFIVQNIDYQNGYLRKESNSASFINDLDQLYRRIQWSIDHIKPRKAVESKSFTSCFPIETVDDTLLDSCKEETTNLQERRDSSNTHVSNSSAVSSLSSINQPIVKNKRAKKSLKLCRVKDQKKSIDSEVDPAYLLRTRQAVVIENEIAEPASSRNESETNENLLSSNNGSSSVNDLFDYNPIINYFNYNKKAKDIKLIDEKKINDDEFVKKSFEKYTLKLCTVNVIDCFTDTCLKIFKSTPFDSTVVNLDENLKKKLNLITSSKSNNLRSSKLNIKRKTSRCLQRKSQLNAVDSVISEVSRRDSSVSNNEISTTLKTKRKRNGMASNESPEELKENDFRLQRSPAEQIKLNNLTEFNSNDSKDETKNVCSKTPHLKERKISEFFRVNNVSASSNKNENSFNLLAAKEAITQETIASKLNSEKENEIINDDLDKTTNSPQHKRSKTDSKTVNDENDSQNNATLKTSANYLSPTKKKALAESTAINSSPLILSKTVSPDETENLMSLGFLTEFQKEFNLTTFLKAKESADKTNMGSVLPDAVKIELSYFQTPANNESAHQDYSDDCEIIEVLEK